MEYTNEQRQLINNFLDAEIANIKQIKEQTGIEDFETNCNSCPFTEEELEKIGFCDNCTRCGLNTKGYNDFMELLDILIKHLQSIKLY